jgi:hypothetical protein
LPTHTPIRGAFGGEKKMKKQKIKNRKGYYGDKKI